MVVQNSDAIALCAYVPPYLPGVDIMPMVLICSIHCFAGSENRTAPAFILIKQLNKEVVELSNKYQMVIIDGTPQLSELADRTILASDLLLIPLTPSIYDYRGFENFLGRYEQVKGLKEASGSEIKAFVVLNRVVPNSNVSKDITIAVKEYEIGIMQTQLVNRVAYVDSASEGKGVVEYKDKKASAEIEKLLQELHKKDTKKKVQRVTIDSLPACFSFH